MSLIFVCVTNVHWCSFKAVRYHVLIEITLQGYLGTYDRFHPTHLPENYQPLFLKTCLYPQKHYCFEMGGSLKWLTISVMTHNVLYFLCQQAFFFLFSNSRYPFSDNDTLRLSNGWCVNFLSIVQTKLELHVDVVRTTLNQVNHSAGILGSENPPFASI